MSLLAVQETLIHEYEQRKARNPQYSYRAFAAKLNLSSGALSAIINGKRKISRKLAIRIAAELQLKEDKLNFFLSPFSNQQKPNQQMSSLTDVESFLKYYKVVSDWPFLAILTMLELDDFQSCPQWIAKRLDLPEAKVTDMLQTLEELKFIEKAGGRYVKGSRPYRTSDNIQNMALRNAHKATLELAAKKLYSESIERRDMVAMTMAIDDTKVDYAKKRIRQFMLELSNELEAGAKTEVYKMSIQLFPLTKKQENIQ